MSVCRLLGIPDSGIVETCLSNRRQNERLALLVTVGSYTEIDLLAIGVGLERLGDAWSVVNGTGRKYDMQGVNSATRASSNALVDTHPELDREVRQAPRTRSMRVRGQAAAAAHEGRQRQRVERGWFAIACCAGQLVDAKQREKGVENG
jgi:hypothetical protein